MGSYERGRRLLSQIFSRLVLHTYILTSTKMYGFRQSGQDHLCATWRRRDSGYLDGGYQVLTMPLGFLLTVNSKINFGRMLREGSLSSQHLLGAGPAPEDPAGCSFPMGWAAAPCLTFLVWTIYLNYTPRLYFSVGPTGKRRVYAIRCSLVAIILVFGCWVFC